ncbi:MAG: hypothetical protein KC468_25615 [Myxococcales bacterium]|nr:hypothetical protein [Myxococcales bacterium]
MTSEPTPTKFGTFTGVFTPTLLTILGVIMYVRIGWVVGNAGLGGAFLVLGLGILITTCTGLSLSSVATNTRIGAGGPYAIMNKSLGLEVGGSIGIPLYLTRPLGVAMYIFGFREGVLWVLSYVPTLPVAAESLSLPIDLLTFALLFGIAYRSADLAFKTQYVIMGLIALSLISIFASPVSWREPVDVQWFGEYRGDAETGFLGTDFWGVFAVFFPATTGILAGANMSGDLKDPRRAIPHGTLWAIGISTVIYFAIAVWCARTGSLDALSGNYNHVIDHSLVPALVLAGLLGATASSALAGLVGGPRILMAMGEERIVPFSDELATLRGGEPRSALLVTGVLTIACIMVRDLNAIAPLVTMFFLITYSMINVVVLVESMLGLVSYRPTLKLPLLVPALGLIGCTFSMFIINPLFSLVSIALVVVLYFFIRHRVRDRAGAKEDVRSSIFTAFSEWAAGKVTLEDMENVRAWKPHVLVPTRTPEAVRGSYPLLQDLASPEGSVNLLGIPGELPTEVLSTRLEELSRAFRGQRVLSFFSTVSNSDFRVSVITGLEALQSSNFRPNLLFKRLSDVHEERLRDIEIFSTALERRVGVLLYGAHPIAGLGRKSDINLWIRGNARWDVDEAFHAGNLDLMLLMGFRLSRIWRGRLTLVTVIQDASETEAARAFLGQITDLARLPQSVVRVVYPGTLDEALASVQIADLSIFGLRRADIDLDWASRMVQVTRGSCLFVLDSGRESARA